MALFQGLFFSVIGLGLLAVTYQSVAILSGTVEPLPLS